MGNSPGDLIKNAIPFRHEAVEDIECAPRDGVVACQIGITGAPAKQNVVLTTNPGFKRAKCVRGSDGTLNCELELDNSERTRVTL